MADFALIGAAGYIAPRHMAAIKESGNKLVAAMDKNDSVGVIDRYFPEASFFTEFERFDRYINKLSITNHPIHYLSVCTPNYLHDAHIRFGLRNNASVICEKPVVLHPKNIAPLVALEKETGKRVFTILQLRLHPAILALKEQLDQETCGSIHDVDLTYITPRGNWYYASWKGDEDKSGGIVANIGIHFFDLLLWLFGEVEHSDVHLYTHDRAAGFLQLKKARVRWFLSISKDTLTKGDKASDAACRSLTVDGRPVDFTKSSEDLILKTYIYAMQDKGAGLMDALPSIELIHQVRQAARLGLQGDYHPLAALPLNKHPFQY